MKGKLTKSFLAVILIISFTLTSVCAYSLENIPNASSKFVNDFANVISNEKEISMSKRAETLLNNYNEGVQVMVVTIESLKGETIENYALRMYNTYGIGKKDVNIGVLILVSINDRKTRVATGAGTGKFISDDEATTLAQIGNSYFKNGNFGEGLEAIQIATINKLNAEMQAMSDVLIEASNEDTAAINVNDSVTQNTELDNKIVELEKKNHTLKIILAFLSVIIVYLIYKNACRKRDFEEISYALDVKKKEQNAIETNLKNTSAALGETSRELERLNWKFEFIKEHLDSDIEKKLDKKVAELFDNEVQQIINRNISESTSSEEIYSYIEMCETLLEEYSHMTEAQKKEVMFKNHLKAFKRKLEKEFSRREVKELERKVEELVNGISEPSRHNYHDLKHLRESYLYLSEDEKSMFDLALFYTLDEMFKVSMKKHNDYYYSSNSSSSYSTSNSYNYASDDSSSYSFDAGDGGCSDGGGGSSDW